MRNVLGAALVAAIGVLPAAARAHGSEAHATPPARPAPSVNTSRWGAGYFPNVPLVTDEGKTVRFYDDLLKGKSVAVNVIYTDCKDVCPL